MEMRALLDGALQEVCDLARNGQQLLDLIGDVNHVADGITNLHNRQPDLGPELLAALKALNEASQALARAVDTSSALSEARRNRLTNEGGPS